MKLRTVLLAASLAAAVAHPDSSGARTVLLRASSARKFAGAPSPAAAEAFPPEPAHAEGIEGQEVFAGAPSPATAPAGLADSPMQEELQAPVKGSDDGGVELPSVLLRFELRNVDFTRLDEPTDVSPLLGAAAPVESHNLKHPGFETIEEHEHQDMQIVTEKTETNRRVLESSIKEAVESLLAKHMPNMSNLNEAAQNVEHHPDPHEVIGGASIALVGRNWTSTNSADLLHALSVAKEGRVKLITAMGGATLDNVHQEHVHHREASALKMVYAHVAAPAPAAAAIAAAPSAALAGSPAAAEQAPSPAQPSGLRMPDAKDGAPQHAAAEQAAATDNVDWPPLMSVSFEPGFVKKGRSRKTVFLSSKQRDDVLTPRSTIVKVNIVDKPGTKANTIGMVEDALRSAIEDGSLASMLAGAIFDAVHIRSVVGTIFEEVGSVKPYNNTACASHLQSLVHGFSEAYTRDRLPDALFHACDNYGQKESFSDDGVVDKHDRRRCHEATKRFMHLWQHGTGKVDYGRYCLELCEITHGEDAIRCDAYKYIAVGP